MKLVYFYMASLLAWTEHLYVTFSFCSHIAHTSRRLKSGERGRFEGQKRKHHDLLRNIKDSKRFPQIPDTNFNRSTTTWMSSTIYRFLTKPTSGDGRLKQFCVIQLADQTADTNSWWFTKTQKTWTGHVTSLLCSYRKRYFTTQFQKATSFDD